MKIRNDYLALSQALAYYIVTNEISVVLQIYHNNVKTLHIFINNLYCNLHQFIL